MARGGFLVRGTLMPAMGSTTSTKASSSMGVGGETNTRKRVNFPVKSSSANSGANRIPSSIALRKFQGAR